MEEATIVWTEYMKYRLRNVDTVTERVVAIGRHEKLLLMILYELKGHTLTPVTIHATTRQQINSRIKSWRFKNE